MNTSPPHTNASPKTRKDGTRSHPGIPGGLQVFLALLPFSTAAGAAMVQAAGADPFVLVMDLASLFVAAFMTSLVLSFRLRLRGLVENSSVVFIAGRHRQVALVQTICLLALGAGLLLLCVPGSPVKHNSLWSIINWGVILLALISSRAPVQYWLKSCVVLKNRVIAYEQIESVIQIPWQGFDVRVRGAAQALEIRMKNDESGQLLDALKPVLSPYGIKIQTRSGEKPD